MTIDELVVALSLDPTKFNRGQQQALSSAKKAEEELMKRAKGMEQAATRMNDFFSRLRTEAIGFFAAAAGARGLKDLVSNLVQGDAALGRTSTVLAQSAEVMGKWRAAAKSMGVTSEEMAGAFGVVREQLDLALRGMGGEQLRATLGQISTQGGVAIESWMSVEEILKRVAKNLQNIDKADTGRTGQAAFLARQLPVGVNVQNMLLQGLEKINKALDEAEKKGWGPKQEDIDKAQSLLAVWEKLGNVLDAIARKTFYPVAGPLLDKALELGPEGVSAKIAEGTAPGVAKDWGAFWEAITKFNDTGTKADAMDAARKLGTFLFGADTGAGRAPPGFALPPVKQTATPIANPAALPSTQRGYIGSSFDTLGGGGSGSSSTSVNVNGPVTVNTQATDAEGVARAFGTAMLRQALITAQAQTGAQ